MFGCKIQDSCHIFPKQFLANFLRTKSMGTKAPMPHPHNIFQVLLHAVTLVPFRKKTVLCDTENRRKPNESYVEHRKLQTWRARPFMIFESFTVFEVFGLRSSFSETGKLDLGTQKRPPLAYVTKKNQWILKYNQLFERQMKKTFGIPFSKQNQYTVKIQDLASNVKIRKVNEDRRYLLLAKLQDYSMFSTYQASRIKAPIKKVIHRFSNTANFRRISIKESMAHLRAIGWIEPHKTRPWEGLHSLRVITCYHFPREGPSRLALWARKTDTSSKLVVL